jgi:hypothetical protein
MGKAMVTYYTSWVVAYCDMGILDYYHWWYKKKKGVKLAKPKHGSHISIVRGLEDGIEKGWWYRNADDQDSTKQTIEFHYSNNIAENNTHVWLPIWGEQLVQVRKDLGLSERPRFDYHLTLGMFPWYQEVKQSIYGDKK